jgi:regulator of protease activity HflC (stomatin/prohibitin superfamily)
MKTTTFLTVIFAIFSVSLISSCGGCNRVEANYEGVLMTNYGRNGKSDFAAATGSQGILGPGSELYQVPMFEQAADPVAMEVITKDGGRFTVDPSYTYQAMRGKGVDIIFSYKQYGTGEKFMDNIEGGVLNRVVLNAYREEASKFTNDSLLYNVRALELAVENRLKAEFNKKFFEINGLTSGIKPPQTMLDAVERKNNAIQEASTVENQLETSRMLLEKAKIDAERNRVESSGLTKEILQQQWIEAISKTGNKVIITDGKTPIILN